MSHFKVIYLTGGREDEAIEADDYTDDRHSIVFRRNVEGEEPESVMRVRSDAVDHVKTID